MLDRFIPYLPALLLACGSGLGGLAARYWPQDGAPMVALFQDDVAAVTGAVQAGALLRNAPIPGAVVVDGDPGLASRLRREGAWLVLAWRGQLACMLTL